MIYVLLILALQCIVSTSAAMIYSGIVADLRRQMNSEGASVARADSGRRGIKS